jgi:hypothetical protein
VTRMNNNKTLDELKCNALAPLAVIVIIRLRCNAGGDAAMNKPLSLSDHQLRQIHAAARTLLPSQSSDCVHGVWSRRLGDNPSNRAVQATISAEVALNRLPAFLCSK